MALEDWEKATETYDRITYKKKGIKHRIIIGRYDDYSGWYFIFKDENKSFKTKSKAIAYAKHYMKTH